MALFKHGLNIGISRIENDFFLTLKIVGMLTHEDYNKITPMIDNALKGFSDAKIKTFIDLTQFEGWELRAAWDDFKLGLRHGSEFEKIAILGNKKWEELMVKVGNWFISGEIKYFADENEAISWLKS